MGQCLGLEYSEQRKSEMKSKEIDKQISESEKEDQNIIKILILGTGESGKSTLVKQMKIIHNEGYTKQEMMNFRVSLDILFIYSDICFMKFIFIFVHNL